MTVKTEYLDIVKNSLRTLKGPFRAQALFGNVIYNPRTNRVSLFVVGEDRNGEDVLDKPIIITFNNEGKISIEKNNTDLDIRKELVKRGVPEEDIIQK